MKPEKREYQEKAIRKIEHFRGRALLAHQMRMGKTFVALQWLKNHPEIRPAVVVCPEIGKLHWEEKAKRYFDMRSVVLNGIVPTKRKFLHKNQLYILNWEILQYWTEFLRAAGVTVAILDECFVYETLIHTNYGILPIGEIVKKRLNVKVQTYNYFEKKIEMKPILRYIEKRRTKRLVRVRHESGYFDCTVEHKVWENESNDYKKACELQNGDVLCLLRQEVFVSKDREENKKILLSKMCKTCVTKTFNKKKLRNLWKGIQFSLARKMVQFKKKILQPVLFSKMENDTARNTSTNLYGEKNSKSERIQKEMVQNKRRSFFQKSGIRKDEKVKCKSAIPKENEKDLSKQKGKNLVRRTWRQWFHNRSSTTTFKADETSNGIYNKNCESKASFPKSAELLQGRFGNSKKKNRNRGRWWKSQNKKAKISRPQKNRSLKLVRVESVEILEQGCAGQHGICNSKNSSVYDLEIEKNHNYFANNILVSNCH